MLLLTLFSPKGFDFYAAATPLFFSLLSIKRHVCRMLRFHLPMLMLLRLLRAYTHMSTLDYAAMHTPPCHAITADAAIDDALQPLLLRRDFRAHAATRYGRYVYSLLPCLRC